MFYWIWSIVLISLAILLIKYYDKIGDYIIEKLYDYFVIKEKINKLKRRGK
jgi:hypothetical protein